jgi:regulator of protease activity HflC (stomatin/prohibitin superfamily)
VFLWIIFIEVLLVLGVICLTGITVVKEYERGVFYRWGRFINVKQPGKRYVFPFSEKMVKIDLRTKTVEIPEQEVITNDNIPLKIDAVLYYKVQDPIAAVNKVEDYGDAIYQGAQTTVRNVVGQHSLDDLLSKRDIINSEIRKIIDVMSDPWGIKVTSVEIKEVNLPENMQRAMAKEAEAEREKRARIIKAEGELISTNKLQHAAKIISAHPSILELRRMQMVSEVGMENNSTTIVLMPSEFVTMAKGIGKLASGKGD